jgi:hypothetical protein
METACWILEPYSLSLTDSWETSVTSTDSTTSGAAAATGASATGVGAADDSTTTLAFFDFLVFSTGVAGTSLAVETADVFD